MEKIDDDARRTAVAGLSLFAAVAAVVVLFAEGPPGSGYGWGSVVISAVLFAVPLAGMGLLVRSGQPRFAWPAVGLAALVTVVVLLALVGNWKEQSASARILDTLLALLVVGASLGVVAVERPWARRAQP